MRKDSNLIVLLLFILSVFPIQAAAGLLDPLCLIESPVRGLSVDDVSPEGFSVEWKYNIPPEIPTSIRVSMNGQDATPTVPWWMMLFDKGAGMSRWGHGVEPGKTYRVQVSQRSVCGKWTSSTVSVTTPDINYENTGDASVDAAKEHINAEIAEAPSNIADTNDEYYWTETLVCDPADEECEEVLMDFDANQRDELAIWDPRYDGAQIDSIMDDGQRTYIRTNDLSPITVYKEGFDGELTEITVYYDPSSGVSSFPGDPRRYKIFVGGYLVEITDESGDYGSAPEAQVCDPAAAASCV